MDLPKCHYEAIEKAETTEGTFRDKLTAYHAALKEQGMAREAAGYIFSPDKPDWMADSGIKSIKQAGDFPALIIRMEQK